MPDAYEIHDARFIQSRLSASAANAVTHFTALCPSGKVWTVLGVCYYPSVAETRIIIGFVVDRAGLYFPLNRPVSVALDATYQLFTPITEGMEVKLYPGEYIRIVRDAATAGSTMSIGIRFIETDLPYYSHTELLKKAMAPKLRHSSVERSISGISGSGSPGESGGAVGGGGRDTGSIPI